MRIASHPEFGATHYSQSSDRGFLRALGIAPSGLSKAVGRYKTVKARYKTIEAMYKTVDTRYKTVLARYTTVEARYEIVEANFKAGLGGMDQSTSGEWSRNSARFFLWPSRIRLYRGSSLIRTPPPLGPTWVPRHWVIVGSSGGRVLMSGVPL